MIHDADRCRVAWLSSLSSLCGVAGSAGVAVPRCGLFVAQALTVGVVVLALSSHLISCGPRFPPFATAVSNLQGR